MLRPGRVVAPPERVPVEPPLMGIPCIPPPPPPLPPICMPPPVDGGVVAAPDEPMPPISPIIMLSGIFMPSGGMPISPLCMSIMLIPPPPPPDMPISLMPMRMPKHSPTSRNTTPVRWKAVAPIVVSLVRVPGGSRDHRRALPPAPRCGAAAQGHDFLHRQISLDKTV